MGPQCMWRCWGWVSGALPTRSPTSPPARGRTAASSPSPPPWRLPRPSPAAWLTSRASMSFSTRSMSRSAGARTDAASTTWPISAWRARPPGEAKAGFPATTSIWVGWQLRGRPNHGGWRGHQLRTEAQNHRPGQEHAPGSTTHPAPPYGREGARRKLRGICGSHWRGRFRETAGGSRGAACSWA